MFNRKSKHNQAGSLPDEQYRAFQRELEKTEINMKDLKGQSDDAGKKLEDAGKKAKKSGGRC